MPSLWFWSTGEEEEESKKNETMKLGDSTTILSEAATTTGTSPPHLIASSAFLLGSTTSLIAIYVYSRFFKRIPNAEWVTPVMITNRRWIKGYVTSVGDSDNFRIYHTPGIGWRWPLKFRRIPSTAKELKDQTIHIRIAGVDAPEAAHFGRPAQAYAEESLAWLKNSVQGKFVYCQIARRDQYGRIVALPHLMPRFLPSVLFPGKCISLEMLRAGWVETYEQSGAEYGRYGKDEFLRIQADAQLAQRGIWKHGLTRESPAEYKRRYARSTDQEVQGPRSIISARRSNVRDHWRGGWFWRLFWQRS